MLCYELRRGLCGYWHVLHIPVTSHRLTQRLRRMFCCMPRAGGTPPPCEYKAHPAALPNAQTGGGVRTPSTWVMHGGGVRIDVGHAWHRYSKWW